MADPAIEVGFLLAEDEALRAKLSDLNVPSSKPGGTRVHVWYRTPAAQKERRYPFITIELQNIVFANDRAHSAQLTPIDYWPSEAATFAAYAANNNIPFNPDEDNAEAMWWLPYNLYYEVTTHCRSIQQHRYLQSKLIGTAYLPDRFGYLQVPADGSSRWLDRVGMTPNDYYENEGGESKPVFSTRYTIMVTADVPPENPIVFRKVLTVAGRLTGIDGQEPTYDWTESA